ncbi:uncharacterized protein LOC135944025 [Cloeon dipterum]|uniref:uncharacterized protein LOC135944025 n=1 Tax=Cloeon dipterum TaxID=197152 RepID=UPI00321F8E97
MIYSGIMCWLLSLLVINAVVCEIHTTEQQENEPGEGLPNIMVNQSEGNEKSKNNPVIIANQSKTASANNLIDSQQCQDVKNIFGKILEQVKNLTQDSNELKQSMDRFTKTINILEQVKNLTQDFNEFEQLLETFMKTINYTVDIRTSTLISSIAALISSPIESQLASATEQLSEMFTELKMDCDESIKVRLAIESYKQTIENHFKSMEDMFQNDDRLTKHDLRIELDPLNDTIVKIRDLIVTIRSEASEVRQFCETLKTDGDAEDIKDIKQNIKTILAIGMASSTVLTEITEKVGSLQFQSRVLFLVLVLGLLIQFVTALVIVTCWWNMSNNASYSPVNQAIPMRSLSRRSNIGK